MLKRLPGIKKGKPLAWSTQSGKESSIVGRTSKGSCNSTSSNSRSSRSSSSLVDCAGVACIWTLNFRVSLVCAFLWISISGTLSMALRFGYPISSRFNSSSASRRNSQRNSPVVIVARNPKWP